MFPMASYEKSYRSTCCQSLRASHCLYACSQSCVHILDIKSSVFSVSLRFWQACTLSHSTPVMKVYQVSAKTQADHWHYSSIPHCLLSPWYHRTTIFNIHWQRRSTQHGDQHHLNYCGCNKSRGDPGKRDLPAATREPQNTREGCKRKLQYKRLYT